MKRNGLIGMVTGVMLGLFIVAAARADTELKALPMGGGLVAVPVKPYRKPLPELIEDAERTMKILEMNKDAQKELRWSAPSDYGRKTGLSTIRFTNNHPPGYGYFSVQIDCADEDTAKLVKSMIRDFLKTSETKLQKKLEAQEAEINKGHG